MGRNSTGGLRIAMTSFEQAIAGILVAVMDFEEPSTSSPHETSKYGSFQARAFRPSRADVEKLGRRRGEEDRYAMIGAAMLSGTCIYFH